MDPGGINYVVIVGPTVSFAALAADLEAPKLMSQSSSWVHQNRSNLCGCGCDVYRFPEDSVMTVAQCSATPCKPIPSKFRGCGFTPKFRGRSFWNLLLYSAFSGPPQKGLSPEFRATRLSRREKKGPIWGFSAYFPVFKAEKDPQKICAKPWSPVIRA